MALFERFGSSPAGAGSSSSGEELYGRIYAALQTMQSAVDLPCGDRQTVLDSFRQVLAEHPELFWAGPGCSLVQQGLLGGHIQLRPAISGSPAQIRQQQLEMERAVTAILSRVQSRWTPYEKARYLHDYLATHTRYDGSTSASIDRQSRRMYAPRAATAYGCLVEQRAVCAGYASAYQLLLRRLGIGCLRVKGRAEPDGGHEWNVISLDGSWTNVDVTWDSPTTAGSAEQILSHAYFCVPDAELRETHQPDPGQRLPICSSTDYDYYRRMGLYLPRYDAAQVALILSKAARDSSVELKFGSAGERQRAIDELFTRRGIFRMQGSFGPIHTIEYFTGRGKRVLRLTIG